MARDEEHFWKRTLLTTFAVVAAPIVLLNGLLAFNIFSTAQREVDGLAAESLALAESRLDEAATALISLGIKGVRSCGDADVAALGQALNRSHFIAEAGLTDAAGERMCATTDAPRVVRRLSPEHGTISPDVAISLVGLGDSPNAKMIRMQWLHPDGVTLRVLAYAQDIFPYFLKSRITAGFIADARLIDGAVIARKLTDERLAEPDPTGLPPVIASAASQRYPLRIAVATPVIAVARANATLFIYANIAGLAIALVAAAVSVLLNRRSGGPIREIADGIRKGEFVPYYQPVINISNGRLAGCEVLVRWKKPDGRIVPPGRFVALAEASGEIFPMTLSLMETARDDLADLYSERPTLKLGFNLCAGHFEDLSLIGEVERIFLGSALNMTQLMFEVTERQPLQDIERARQIIAKLQSLGARVALDDVGTGHGGLSYLLKLGVDVMKMDKMFVDAIGTDRYSVAIVDSMVKLAEDMNLDLIAEGVETFEQVEYLRNKGVRLAQGYVFAPPLPASSFRALVEAMAPVRRRDPREGAAAPGRFYNGALRSA